MKTIRAIVINPEDRTVSERQIEPTLGALYDVIGASCVDTIRIAQGPVVWVDDEGLLQGRTHGWVPVGWGSQPIMGAGVITAIDRYGDPQSTTATVDQIRGIIANWYEGESPEPKITVLTVGDLCQMCGNHPLRADDLFGIHSGRRDVCARCRGGR